MLHQTTLFIKRNAPTILTWAGAAGVVATTILAVKATPKALDLIDDAKHEKGEKLTKVEKVVAAAPAYIPTAIVGVSTITCIFSANILNKRTQAAITSAYALLNSSYKEYKDKVMELYGEEKHDEVIKEIAQDKYEPSETEDDGKLLFYEEYSGQYFRSTIEEVQRAEYRINRDLTMRDYAYLNEFYELLGLPQTDEGWKLGWSTGACLDMYWQPWIDFTHKKVTMDDGMECYIVTMFQEPILNFEDYA